MHKKKNENILKSTDINEIEKYLQQTHSDDPKKIVLKRKLVALKNEAWTKGAKNYKPMEPRSYIELETIINNTIIDEKEEFNKLWEKQSSDHSMNTANLLSSMFSNDEGSDETICMITNKSDCNIIMRFEGIKNYALPVPAKKSNMLVIKKGKYILKSYVCGSSYVAQKEISKHVEVQLQKKML
jgi:hypothetical protein